MTIDNHTPFARRTGPHSLGAKNHLAAKGESMARFCAALTTLVAMGMIGAGCGDGPDDQPRATASPTATGTEGQGSIRLSVSYAPWGSQAAKVMAPHDIDDATVYVYASDGAEIARQQLAVAEGRATGELTVRAAKNLRVVLVFRDGDVVRYIGEDAHVDVEIGQETTAILVCHYLGTWVRAPEIVGVDRPYTVSWAARPHATGYEVQEATSPDFTDATHVYEGTGLSHGLAGKREIGVTYHYRARAGSGYGLGPWHSTGTAAVEIHKPEGRILVDVQIPPDEPDTPPPPMEVVADTSLAHVAVTLDFDGATGMTWKDGHLLVLVAYTNIVVEIDPENGSEIAVYIMPVPSMDGSDLAWDGEHLWVAPFNGPVSKIRFSDLAVVSQYELRAGGFRYIPHGGGITFDGSNVWVHGTGEYEPDGGSDVIAGKVLPGQTLPQRGIFWLGPGMDEFELYSEADSGDPGGFLYGDGFAWDGTYLWASNDDGLRKYDPQGYLVAFLISRDQVNVEGCAFGNGLVWYGDWVNDTIYGIEP